MSRDLDFYRRIYSLAPRWLISTAVYHDINESISRQIPADPARQAAWMRALNRVSMPPLLQLWTDEFSVLYVAPQTLIWREIRQHEGLPTHTSRPHCVLGMVHPCTPQSLGAADPSILIDALVRRARYVALQTARYVRHGDPDSPQSTSFTVDPTASLYDLEVPTEH